MDRAVECQHSVLENHSILNFSNVRNLDLNHVSILQPPRRILKCSNSTRRPRHDDRPGSQHHPSAQMSYNGRNVEYQIINSSALLLYSIYGRFEAELGWIGNLRR